MTHFGYKIEVKGIVVRPKPRCGDNIKINLKKQDGKMRTEFIWLRRATSRGDN